MPKTRPESADAPGTRTFTEYRIECREKGTRNPWRYIPFPGAGNYTDEAAAWEQVRRQAAVPGARFDFRVTRRTKTVTTTAWEE